MTKHYFKIVMIFNKPSVLAVINHTTITVVNELFVLFSRMFDIFVAGIKSLEMRHNPASIFNIFAGI